MVDDPTLSSNHEPPEQPSSAIYYWLAAVVVATLYFGLRPKEFRPLNNVGWDSPGPGLEFGQSGIAYTEPVQLGSSISASTSASASAPSAGSAPGSGPSGNDVKAEVGAGLSLELAIRPEDLEGGLSCLLVVHSPGAEQLFIGQWRSQLMIMHGEDYPNIRRTPKIYLDISGATELVLVTIVSGADEAGTQVYLNGSLEKESQSLRLRWPGAGDRGQPVGKGARVVLGSSVNGHNSWSGLIGGVAIYGSRLTAEQVAQHYRSWRATRNLGFARSDRPELLFPLTDGAGEWARDRSGHGRDLFIPARMKILEKEFLSWELGGGRWGILSDTLINFFGFFPLGFLLAIVLPKSMGAARRTGAGREVGGQSGQSGVEAGSPGAGGGEGRVQAESGVSEGGVSGGDVSGGSGEGGEGKSGASSQSGSGFAAGYFLAAVAIGFGLSLIIELTQAWIPSRSSSLPDLALNTAGTAVAVWLARKLRVRG